MGWYLKKTQHYTLDRFRDFRIQERLLAVIVLRLKGPINTCLSWVRSAAQMKAIPLNVVRLISRCDIVWFRKRATIQLASDIYGTCCALNGKLEWKFSLKHGFFSTKMSIIQNREQWIFFRLLLLLSLSLSLPLFFWMDQAMQIVN